MSIEVSEPWYADLVNYLVTKQVPNTFDKYKRDKLRKKCTILCVGRPIFVEILPISDYSKMCAQF